MEQIARLTPKTTIERDDEGVTWIVTTDEWIAVPWRGKWDAGADLGDNTFVSLKYWDDLGYGRWRIPLLTAHREVYAYREGEPWCWTEGHTIGVRGPAKDVQPLDIVLHLNAVILCGGNADSLRTYLDIVRAQEEK